MTPPAISKGCHSDFSRAQVNQYCDQLLCISQRIHVEHSVFFEHPICSTIFLTAGSLHIKNGFGGVCRQDQRRPFLLDHHIILYPHPKSSISLWATFIIFTDVQSYLKPDTLLLQKGTLEQNLDY